MPDSTFLHIRRRDSTPTRVLELAEPSVRVGCGPDCEVRLGDESLAEVHCLLHRRGEDWQVEPAAEVLIDGLPVESGRPLAPGEVLRVGDHWLTLQADASPASGRGSFDSPIAVDGVEVESNQAEPPPSGSPTRPRQAGFEAAEERLARWQASQQQRDRWLRDRQKERGWESRWKAAGDALRARSSTSPPVAPAAPYRSPESTPREPARTPPVATPPIAPSTIARPEPIAEPPVSIPFPAPAAPELRVVAAPEPEPVVEEPTFVREPAPVVEPEISERFEPKPVEAVDPQVEAAFPTAEVETEIREEPVEADEEDVEPEARTEPDPASGSGERPADWPSVQSILAARASRTSGRSATLAEPAGSALRSPSRAAAEAPTEGRAPGSWNVPGWLALPVAALTCLIAGGGGSALAWTWARDAQVAGPIADRVLKGGDLPGSGELPEVANVGGSWWGSTAEHLYLLAIAADRSEADPDREDRTRFFLQAARRASPLRADVRLAIARRTRPEPGSKTTSDAGLSRDIVSLAWAGHERLASGRRDEARDFYFAALDMAARAEPPEVVPAFEDGEESRRFRIAGEEALESVLVDMADGPDWTFAEWSAALPATAVVRLAAYRVLKAREAPEAEKLLADAASSAGPQPGHPRAIQLAARAEALAIQGRWADAEAVYREAIAARSPGPIRRSWWANLADLDGRIGDEARRREAWDAAVAGAGAGDEIGRQVARARGRAGLGGRRDQAEGPASKPAPGGPSAEKR